MNSFHTLFLILLPLLSLSVTPSTALGPATPSLATAPFPTSSVSSSLTSPSTSNAPSTAAFANVTTTNAEGSTIVASIPITVSPSITPTTTSSTPYPSLSGYPTCVTNCLTDAVAQVNCTSITAVGCYCINRTFPAALYNCVVANCSSNVPSAENLAQQFCALDNTTLSFASTAAPSTSSASSRSSTLSGSSALQSPSTSSNAATAGPWMADARAWTGMALAACGAVFGAALL